MRKTMSSTEIMKEFASKRSVQRMMYRVITNKVAVSCEEIAEAIGAFRTLMIMDGASDLWNNDTDMDFILGQLKELIESGYVEEVVDTDYTVYYRIAK